MNFDPSIFSFTVCGDNLGRPDSYEIGVRDDQRGVLVGIAIVTWVDVNDSVSIGFCVSPGQAPSQHYPVVNSLDFVGKLSERINDAILEAIGGMNPAY